MLADTRISRVSTKERLCDRGLDALGDAQGIAGIVNGVEQNREFISAQPEQDSLRRRPAALATSHRFVCSQAIRKPAAEFQQDMIARCRAHGFVENLEVIHVH